MRIIEERNENEKKVVCGHCGSDLAYYESGYFGVKYGEWEHIKTENILFDGVEITERRPVYILLECPICEHEIKCSECFEERKFSK